MNRCQSIESICCSIVRDQVRIRKSYTSAVVLICNSICCIKSAEIYSIDKWHMIEKVLKGPVKIQKYKNIHKHSLFTTFLFYLNLVVYVHVCVCVLFAFISQDYNLNSNKICFLDFVGMNNGDTLCLDKNPEKGTDGEQSNEQI